MDGQKRYFRASSGWDEELNDHQNLSQKIIDLANSRLSLNSVLEKYGVKLDSNYSHSGWRFKGSCPFPDHKDKRPSFGYNPDNGCFNCFGCHRGGKAVEFISNMESRRRIDVAREIIGTYSEDEVLLHNSNFDFEKLQEILFNFADRIRAFKTKYNSSEAKKYVKSVSWNLDVYLQKNALQNTIILEDLEARIEKLDCQLDAYGDSD